MISQLSKKKGRKDGKLLKGKFALRKDQPNYNILSVIKTYKPKPRIPSYQGVARYQPRYSPSTTSLPIDITAIRNAIAYGLPPPKSPYSVEGQKAQSIANMAFDFLNKGEFRVALDCMINALRVGVPEPMNSRLKKILLDSIDSATASSNLSSERKIPLGKICPNCGKSNNDINKFCVNCGRLL